MVSVVQWSEHWIVVPGVGGSSPLAHPIFCRSERDAPVAQWIEHQPPELRAGGSNPLRRAICRSYWSDGGQIRNILRRLP